jgi:hypothetical protein
MRCDECDWGELDPERTEEVPVREHVGGRFSGKYRETGETRARTYPAQVLCHKHEPVHVGSYYPSMRPDGFCPDWQPRGTHEAQFSK